MSNDTFNSIFKRTGGDTDTFLEVTVIIDDKYAGIPIDKAILKANCETKVQAAAFIADEVAPYIEAMLGLEYE